MGEEHVGLYFLDGIEHTFARLCLEFFVLDPGDHITRVPAEMVVHRVEEAASSRSEEGADAVAVCQADRLVSSKMSSYDKNSKWSSTSSCIGKVSRIAVSQSCFQGEFRWSPNP